MTTLTQRLDVRDGHRSFPDPGYDEPATTSWPQSHPDTECSSALRRSALFESLGEGVELSLAREFEIFSADHASILFAEGDPAEHLYVVLCGKVKLTSRAHDGREKLVELLGPSDHFGEISLLDSAPRTTTAAVVSEARLARLPKDALHKLIARHPQLATQLLRMAARRLRRTHANLSNVVFVDTSGRVAMELLRLARRFGVPHGDVIRIEHDLSQAEIAQLVGASRETVNKILSNYAARGWVRVEPKCVIVLNRKRLAQRAHSQQRAISEYQPYRSSVLAWNT